MPAAQLIVLLWLIWRRTPQAPLADEWELVNFLELAESGWLGLVNFWEFQNEHRIFLPRLLLYGLIALTGWDRQIIMTMNLGLACGTAALILGTARRTIGRGGTMVLLVPLAGLLFSFAQYENWLFAFQTNFILAAAGVACCLRGLLPTTARRREGWGFALALVGATVASLSTLGGLLAWAAFFPVTWLRGPRRAALWAACAAGIAIPYASGFPGRTGLEARASIGALSGYGLAYLGAPLGYPSIGLAVAFGLLGLVAMAVCLLFYLRSRGPWGPAAPWLGLALFALANMALTTAGRAGFGLGQALTSRYQIFSALWWVALLVIGWLTVARLREYVPRSRPPSGGRLGAAGGGVLALALLAGLVGTNLRGLIDGAAWQVPAQQRDSCIREYATAPADCLAYFYPAIPTLRRHAAFLEQHHLGPFRTVATPNFARLPAQGNALAAFDSVGNERPASGTIAVAADAALAVRGWALDRAAGGPATAVYLLIDGRYTYRAEYGDERPDVAGATGLPAARRVGFRATLPSGMLAPGDHRLSVRIVAADGRAYGDSAEEIALTVR